jgi:sulfite reductase beta subunit-like hemoprotein
MITKLHFPTLVAGSWPMPTRTAVSVITAIEASARDLAQAAEKTPSRGAASASDETFAEKLKRAVKQRSGKKQHKDRYRHKPRKPTKGE